jgi:hypothetical protein
MKPGPVWDLPHLERRELTKMLMEEQEIHCLDLNSHIALLTLDAASYDTDNVKPACSGLASGPRQVAKRIERALEALSDLTTFVAEGRISSDAREARLSMIHELQVSGWEVTMKGERFKVKAPRGKYD